MIRGFVAECRGLTPDRVLTAPLDKAHFASKGLLGQIDSTNAGTSSGFTVELAGDFVAHEDYSTSLAHKAILCIEIDCDASRNLVTYQVTPSVDQRDEKGLEQSVTRIKLDKALEPISSQYGRVPKLSFKARIFEAHGAGAKWPDYAQGVRVFMEGFRVLPYGTKTDDWLSLKRDVIKRETSRFSSLDLALGSEVDDSESNGRKETLSLKGDHMYMGAVFLTHDGVPDLQMLINREGFLPGAGIESLSALVRLGIQIATRQRSASLPPPARPRGAKPAEMRAATKRAEADSAPTVALLLASVEKAVAALKLLEKLPTDSATEQALAELKEELSIVNDFADELFTEQAMIRVLASLGTQLSAFSHEVAHLLPAAKFVFDGVSEVARALGKSTHLSTRDVRALNLVAIRHEAENLLRSLERQAVYLVDVSGTAARRRRSKQSLAERFENAKRLFQGEIDRLGISMSGELDSSWKTPPMFAAEVTMVLANLLSNAIKAAGKSGKIRIASRSTGEFRVFRMENTGAKVDLADSEKWFKPFRSSATSVDATLGQGMGLGLAITRSILDEYGVSISFVKPSTGFATATEIVFPAES
jgi:signal transduction histidine kinase